MNDETIRSEAAVGIERAKWLAPGGTILAMLACYGITAALSLLSLIGITLAIPFRAPIIVFFSALAALGLASSYKRHRRRSAVLLGVIGFLLVTASKFFSPTMKIESVGLEGAGFLSLVAANILVLRARRRAARVCATAVASPESKALEGVPANLTDTHS